MPKSKKELMQATRKRRKDAGLFPVVAHVRNEQKLELRDFVENELGGECPVKSADRVEKKEVEQ